MSIEWKGGAVCFAFGHQWSDGDKLPSEYGGGVVNADLVQFIKAKDFQLNTIKQGDYIEASELDTEQKYNDAVEVLGLFGWLFPAQAASDYENLEDGVVVLCAVDFELYQNARDIIGNRERKLTYPQLMAIGKLKRAMIERDETVCGEPKSDFVGAINKVKGLDGFVSSNKYEREITDRQGNSSIVDVYDVLKAFNVTCPATQHALKKLLCSGLRGHKDLQTDLFEAKESITRAIELND